MFFDHFFLLIVVTCRWISTFRHTFQSDGEPGHSCCLIDHHCVVRPLVGSGGVTATFLPNLNWKNKIRTNFFLSLPYLTFWIRWPICLNIKQVNHIRLKIIKPVKLSERPNNNTSSVRWEETFNLTNSLSTMCNPQRQVLINSEIIRIVVLCFGAGQYNYIVSKDCLETKFYFKFLVIFLM